MGLMDFLSKQLSEANLNLYRRNVQKVPYLVNNLRHCRNDETRESIRQALSRTMSSIRSVAMSGNPESYQAMRYYDMYVEKFGDVFDEYRVSYK